ncbi:MAG: PAS domain-containing protein [Capsulimonadales bacterium]|nr:PAS domain-containing protein [Capsulimonadales bacterium]
MRTDWPTPARSGRRGEKCLRMVESDEFGGKERTGNGGTADAWAELEREISRRRQAEAERDAVRERLEAALTAGEVATWVWDVAADHVLADRNLLRLFGLPDPGPDGLPIAEFLRVIHAEDRERVGEAIRAALANRREYEVEYRILPPDGRLRWVIARGKAEYDETGAPSRFPGVTLDITVHKQTEEALRESEHKFRMVADTMPQLVWSTRPDGFHDYYNARWFEYTGLTYEDTRGEKWNDVLHPEDRIRAWEVWRRSLETGEPYEIEYRFRRHDGAFRWFIGRALPMRDADGRILRWFGTCTDVDEQKRTEETLRRQQEEIAALNARLRRAMVETHHRVKNNLQLMAALIEMQRNEDEPVSPKALDRLSENVRALGVIHQLLTQEAKEGDAPSLSARAVIEQLIALLAGTVRGRRIVAELDDVRLPGKYATSLALVVNELLSNALKYGAGDVLVRFRIRQTDPGSVLLVVEDDGPGFGEAFDPTGAASTGLELIENIVRFDFQGEAAYENREAGGGRVRIIVPVPETK